MRLRLSFGLTAALFVTSTGLAYAVDYEQEPISYSTATVDDPISRLQAKLAGGESKLVHDDAHGFLASVLKALNVPTSSQVLVFSKTSLQRHLISPSTPRAIYFNDEVYVAWVPGTKVLEIAAVDAQLGSVFYVMPQTTPDRPRFQRSHECLQCHDSSAMTGGVPGLMLRSVFPDSSGQPMLTAGTFVTDQTSRLSERWGGWYATGTHGSLRHMGNVFAHEQGDDVVLDKEAGANVTELKGRFDTSLYLGGGHSDLVALLVLEHQAQMHNLITQANHHTRLALRDEAIVNEALGVPRTARRESTTSRIKAAAEPLVKYMLFSGEAAFGAQISGSSTFAKDYASQGPKDPKGRGLRDLDLRRRLLRHPCSPLIYSKAFDDLPSAVKDVVYARLWDVLSGHDQSRDFAHLSLADRKAVREILLATKPGLPSAWKVRSP